MHIREHIYRSYQRGIFTPLFFGLIIIILGISIFAYVIGSSQMVANNASMLKKIADAVSQKIPVDIHEQLINPSQQNSPEYKIVETYLQSILAANPEIDDIYTLRPIDKPHQYTFVVSGQTTRDRNGNNFIDAYEIKANLGEPYDATDAPDLDQGLITVSVDKSITYDKWGAWISGYAPLKNASGKSVAVVGVDFSASMLNHDKWLLLRQILFADAILIIMCFVWILWLSRRISLPFRNLAEGMNRVLHREFNYRMKGKFNQHNQLYADLFNHMMDVIENEKNNKKASEDE